MKTDITSSKQHVSGVLDPNFSVGKGTIIEYVVMKTLKDCRKECFNYRYDLTSFKYGTINVKSSSRHKGNVNSSWQFKKLSTAYDPDNYICVGLDETFKEILRVWIIPKNSKVIMANGIHVTDSTQGRKRVLNYEVDPTPYNDIYQKLDLTSLPEFCNITVKNFEQYQSIMKDVQGGYSPSDIIDEYGEDIYTQYLSWTKESKLEKCFNLHNGSVGVLPQDRSYVTYPADVFLTLTNSTFPLYDFGGKYAGYIQNGALIKPHVTPCKNKSDINTVKWALQSLTKKYGKASIEALKMETGVEDLETILEQCFKRGDIAPLSNHDYKWIF